MAKSCTNSRIQPHTTLYPEDLRLALPPIEADAAPEPVKACLLAAPTYRTKYIPPRQVAAIERRVGQAATPGSTRFSDRVPNPARDKMLAGATNGASSSKGVVPRNRPTRTYSGWNPTGYHARQEDINSSGNGQGINATHTLPFELDGKNGNALCITIEDTYLDLAGANARSVDSRTFRVKNLPPGIAVESLAPMDVTFLPAHVIWTQPNLDRVIEIILVADTGPYAGMRLKLYVGMVEHTLRSKSYTHKEVVGLEITGRDPVTGNDWDAFFNSHRPLVTDRVGRTDFIEVDDTAIPLSWHTNRYPMNHLPEGFTVRHDALDRPDMALVTLPDGVTILINRDEDPRHSILRDVVTITSAKTDSGWSLGEGLPLQGRVSANGRIRLDPPVAERGLYQTYSFSPDTLLVLRQTKTIGERERAFALTRIDALTLLCYEIDTASYYNISVNALEPGWYGGLVTSEPHTIAGRDSSLIGYARSIPRTLAGYNSKTHDTNLQIAGQNGTLFLDDLCYQRNSGTEFEFDLTRVRADFVDLDGNSRRVFLTHDGWFVVPNVGFFQPRDLVWDGRRWQAEVWEVPFENVMKRGDTLDLQDQKSLPGIAKFENNPDPMRQERFADFALPLFMPNPKNPDQMINHATRQITSIEKPGVTEILNFTGIPLSERYPELGVMEVPQWQFRMSFISTNGKLSPQADNKHPTQTTLNEFTYNEVIATPSGPQVKSHAFKNLKAKIIETKTSPLGWALEVNVLDRKIFLIPYRTKLPWLFHEEGKTEETAAFGFTIASEISGPTPAAELTFQRTLSARGAYTTAEELREKSQNEAAQKTDNSTAVKAPSPVSEQIFYSPLFDENNLENRTDQVALRNAFFISFLTQRTQTIDVQIGEVQFKVNFIFDRRISKFVLEHKQLIEISTPNGQVLAELHHIGNSGERYILKDEQGREYLIAFETDGIHIAPDVIAKNRRALEAWLKKIQTQAQLKLRDREKWISSDKRKQLKMKTEKTFPGKPIEVTLITHFLGDGAELQFEFGGAILPGFRRMRFRKSAQTPWVTGLTTAVVESRTVKHGLRIFEFGTEPHRNLRNQLMRHVFFDTIFVYYRGGLFPIEHGEHKNEADLIRIVETASLRSEIWVNDDNDDVTSPALSESLPDS